jgi:hypothetical protein
MGWVRDLIMLAIGIVLIVLNGLVPYPLSTVMYVVGILLVVIGVILLVVDLIRGAPVA